MIKKEKSAEMIRSLSGLINYQGLVLGVSDEFHGVFVRTANEDRFHDFSGHDFQMDYSQRKKVKPDHESISLVTDYEHDFILAFPSLSKQNRMELGIFQIEKDIEKLILFTERRFKLSTLMHELAQKLNGNGGTLNIEGHFFSGDRLYLMNRGNNIAKNEVIVIPEASFWIDHCLFNGSDERFQYQLTRANVELGYDDDLPLQWTDGIRESDSTAIFLATIEKTDNAYDDGEVVASYVGRYDFVKNEVMSAKRILDGKKAEGICRWNDGYLVCIDSDSPKLGNEFYSFSASILD